MHHRNDMESPFKLKFYKKKKKKDNHIQSPQNQLIQLLSNIRLILIHHIEIGLMHN